MSQPKKEEKKKPSTPASSNGLEVRRAIGPVKPVARAHNKLATLVKTMRGTGGISVVASDGRIVISGTSNSANASELHFSNGSITIDIDANGIKLSNVATSDYTQISPSGAIVMSDSSSGNTLTINPSDLFYGNVTMREFTICSSGAPANVRLASSEDY